MKLSITPKMKEKLTEVVLEKIRNTAERIFSYSQENLVEPKWPINTAHGIVNSVITDKGYLMRSGRIEFRANGFSISYSAPYAEDIEYGAVPGTIVNVREIERWAIRKLRLKPTEASYIAKKIARKIEKKGTQPRPFFMNAILRGLRDEGWKIQLSQ